MFSQGSTCLDLLWIPPCQLIFRLRDFPPSLVSFPKTVLLNLLDQSCGPNPTVHAPWFGLFRFRSPLLTESHVVFSSSGYLDVSVHRVPFPKLWIGLGMLEVCLKQVSPFGDLRIDGYLPLPEAFRSLSRPSSALSAKASTIRSYQHNQTIRPHGNEDSSTHI